MNLADPSSHVRLADVRRPTSTAIFPTARYLTSTRLSRPSLAEQFTLPELTSSDVSHIDPRASLSYPDATDKAFILSPLLSLPTGFGTAFVGSTFSCTICANNELPADGPRSVSSVQVAAEVTTPTQTLTLILSPPDNDATTTDTTPSSHRGLDHGSTLQKLLKFDLREEGPHVLAVSVTYETTTTDASGAVIERRTRSFRKLYQFAAVPCLSVRTKATDMMTSAQAEARDAKQALEKSGERFALEAQLENLTDGPITLEKVAFEARPPFTSTSLNWDAHLEVTDGKGDGPGVHMVAPTLSPRAVDQVCYLVSETESKEGEARPQKEMTKDGRFVLGTLSINWRGPMGELGVLSTGWLTSRRR